MTSDAHAATLRTPGAARDWVKFAIGTVVLAAAYLTVALPAATFDRLIEEDGLIEWLGAIGLFVGGGLLVASFWRARSGPRREGLARWGVWFLLLAGIAVLAFGAEEISWGQRLFGWSTPESLSAVNVQNETTLHNLDVFEGTLDGDRLFRSAWMLFFVVLPVLAVFWPWLRRIRAQLLPISVPLWLAGLFFMAWLLSAIALRTLDGGYTAVHPLATALSELQEATVEILVAISALLTFRSFRA